MSNTSTRVSQEAWQPPVGPQVPTLTSMLEGRAEAEWDTCIEFIAGGVKVLLA